MDVIDDWLTRCQKPYVAFSSGKDSSVLLHLVRQREASVVGLYGHDEYEWPGTQELLRTAGNVIQVCGPVRHAEWFVSWQERPEQLPPGALWHDSVPGDAGSVVGYAREMGCDGAAIGLRSDEAGYRKTHIRASGRLFWAEGKQVWQCYPLADWKDADVWAYLAAHEVPYHPAYDRMAEVGIPMKARRIGPFAPAGAEGPALSNLRRCYPASFNRFAARYPQAATYV
jgi:phosphoadenosine phosphosulfate reductase